jgi:predicted DNA-binding transcriptional regulator AlpA
MTMSTAPHGVRALHDVRTTAKILGLSKSALNKWRVYGKGPKWVRLGRRVRYLEDDLNAWLAENRRSSTSETQR